MKSNHRTSSVSPPRFTELTAARQALIRLCQSVNYRCIENLEIRDADPIFKPPPRALVDVKLDSEEPPRSEGDLSKFALSREICRLMARLDELNTGIIHRIEVRAGIPRRVIYEPRLLGDLPRDGQA